MPLPSTLPKRQKGDTRQQMQSQMQMDQLRMMEMQWQMLPLPSTLPKRQTGDTRQQQMQMDQLRTWLKLTPWVAAGVVMITWVYHGEATR